jgi:hypothetical protein
MALRAWAFDEMMIERGERMRTDALRLPKRHPAWRRREAQSGSRTERENLAGDDKGKGASGSNREAESTDAQERGGLPRSSSPPALLTHSE